MATPSRLLILGLELGIVACLTLFPTPNVGAWEIVTGKVISIQKVEDKTQLTVRLDPQSSNNKATSFATDSQPETSPTDAIGNSSSTSKSAEKADIKVEIASNNLPPKLKEGDSIRIWSKPESPLKPWRISANRSHDPTGVRSRLRGHGRGRRSGRNSSRGGGNGGHGGH